MNVGNPAQIFFHLFLALFAIFSLFSFYVLMVIKVRSRSPETPQCVIIAIERISRGTRTTLTGCNGAIFIEVEYKKDDGKKKKIKTVSFGFWKAQWQAALCLPKSRRYSEKFGQVSDLKIHSVKLSFRFKVKIKSLTSHMFSFFVSC